MQSNVDANLFSRQIFSIGMAAMQRIVHARIAFLGCSGCIAEVAKDVALSGVAEIYFADFMPVSWEDASSNPFVTSQSISSNKNRAQVCCEGISALNPTVSVSSFSSLPTVEQLSQKSFDVIVMCGLPRNQEILYNNEFHGKAKMCVVHQAGLYVQVINDFGGEFVADPSAIEEKKYFVCETALVHANDEWTLQISIDNNENKAVFYRGDFVKVTFGRSHDATETNIHEHAFPVVKVSGLRSLAVDVSKLPQVCFDRLVKGDFYVQTCSVPVVQNHLSLQAIYNLQHADLPLVRNFVHDEVTSYVLFNALATYEQLNQKRPSREDLESQSNFLMLFGECNEQLQRKVLQFAVNCRGEVGPFSAFVGGVVGQEILKAVSHKFIPINQIWQFDLCELYDLTSTMNDFALKKDRYDGLRLVFGESSIARLSNANVFVVGAGAIGCEYLKNLAMCGLGTGSKGVITVTDNDSIEKSNLSRQFLFRDEDIGKPKSLVAAAATKVMNPKVKIRALTEKVTADTQSTVFAERFWNKLDVIATAVDNVSARMLLDDIAVRHRIPLVDSGTLGSKGHVEVIVPFMTNTLHDSPAGDSDHAIPFCTLHYFPSTIDHCIQYATDYFALLFTNTPRHVNTFLESNCVKDFYEKTPPGSRVSHVSLIFNALVRDKPASFCDCVKWARTLFEAVFVHGPMQILTNYPPDAKEADGKPYWGGARKIPAVANFDPTCDDHQAFILAAARLFAQSYSLQFDVNAFNWENVAAFVSETRVPSFTRKEIKIEDKQATPEDSEAALRSCEKQCEILCGHHESQKMSPIVFEKDDDTNGHVTFITAMSNIRASIYGIPRSDFCSTKQIAGRIIPAMITTTAVVTGFATLQLCAMILGKGGDKEALRNLSVDLADIASVQQFEAASLKRKKYFIPSTNISVPNCDAVRDLVGMTFSPWDRFELCFPRDLEIGQVIEAFAVKYYGLRITNLVELVSGKWVFGEGDPYCSFLLGEWTTKVVTVQGSSETADPTPRTRTWYFAVKCASSQLEGWEAAPELPPLRYTVG